MIENELTPEQRAELGDLHGVYEQLQAYESLEPDSARLLASLQPFVANSVETEAISATEPKRHVREWLRLTWKQTELFDAQFWGASILVTLIGLLWGISYGSEVTTLCLLLLSPLIAVSGVAYAFRPATRTLWELEQLSRYRPLELLYSRVLVILAVNVVIALVLLFAASAQGLQIVLWRLLLIWFGPMLGLMSLALFCSVRWNMLVGLMVPMTFWSGLILLGWRESIPEAPYSFSLVSTFIARIAESNTVVAFALIAFIGGIVLLYESGRQMARWD